MKEDPQERRQSERIKPMTETDGEEETKSLCSNMPEDEKAAGHLMITSDCSSVIHLRDGETRRRWESNRNERKDSEKRLITKSEHWEEEGEQV